MSKKIIKNILLINCFILTILFQSCNVRDSKLAEGDIIFQTDTSAYSRAIRLATHSQYSHCGIIFNENGNYYVYEAVQPVKKTLLNKFIARNYGCHYVVKRLINADKFFNDTIIKKMKAQFKCFEGKDYDSEYSWTDDRLYCSELVWKMFYNTTGLKMGNLQHLKDFDLTDNLVKQKLQDEFGDSIPMDEVVISPQSIFNSKLLITVDSI